MDHLSEFFAAVVAGHHARVRQLLEADPSLARARDATDATALHYATLHGDREIVSTLLAAGAEINARDGRHHATPSGWAIEYLREQGGLLAIEIEDLLFAIQNTDTRWARRLLMRHPALAKAADRHGKPLRQHATESGNVELAQLFQDPAV